MHSLYGERVHYRELNASEEEKGFIIYLVNDEYAIEKEVPD